jgi:hypothetical protein
VNRAQALRFATAADLLIGLKLAIVGWRTDRIDLAVAGRLLALRWDGR